MSVPIACRESLVVINFRPCYAYSMQTKTVRVTNIGCDGCVRTIQNEVAEVPGVTAVKADVNSKLVTVNWDDKTSWSEIEAKLVEIDYPPAEVIG